jgi:Ring finger domain
MNQNNDFTCPICLTDIENENNISTTECKHTFHTACLLQNRTNTCPICRHVLYEIVQTEYDSEYDEEGSEQYFTESYDSILTIEEELSSDESEYLSTSDEDEMMSSSDEEDDSFRNEILDNMLPKFSIISEISIMIELVDKLQTYADIDFIKTIRDEIEKINHTITK